MAHRRRRRRLSSAGWTSRAFESLAAHGKMGDQQTSLRDGGNANLRASTAPDLGWIRYSIGAHVDTEVFRAVSEIACGAYQTFCGGGMPISSEPDRESRPARVDRCKRCEWLVEQALRLERGLEELRLADAQTMEVTRG